MNPKENALRIIRFDNPAYVMREAPGHWLSYTGCNHEGFSGGGHHLPVGSTWTDIWGTGWRREHEGVMGFPVIHPLADLPRALRTYRWPDPDDERIYAKIYQSVAGWDRDNQFLVGQHRDTLWEKAYMLVGMEDLMVYFKTEPTAVHELFERITDFQLGIARHYMKLGVELTQCGDDLGTQIGLLLSPRTIREFLIPQYKRLFSYYRQNNVLLEFHSCGHILPLIETFIDLGINILNPIQATANNLDELRRVTMGRMALRGGVSSALLVSGPPEAIENEVKERIFQLGRNGGYFCSPDQGMPWPAENEAAFDQAVIHFGHYPLT
jgi:uroporphyrinogen decarboxylase